MKNKLIMAMVLQIYERNINYLLASSYWRLLLKAPSGLTEREIKTKDGKVLRAEKDTLFYYISVFFTLTINNYLLCLYNYALGALIVHKLIAMRSKGAY